MTLHGGTGQRARRIDTIKTAKLSTWAQGISDCKNHGKSPRTPISRGGYGVSSNRVRNTA